MKYTDASVNVGIYSKGSIALDGTLNLTVAGSSDKGAIHSEKDIVITKGNVTATSNASGYGYAVLAEGNITMSGGQLTADAGNIGTYAGGKITISGGQFKSDGGTKAVLADDKIVLSNVEIKIPDTFQLIKNISKLQGLRRKVFP